MPAVNIFTPQLGANPIGFSPFSPGFTKLIYVQKTFSNADIVGGVLNTRASLVPAPGPSSILLPYFYTWEKNSNAGAWVGGGNVEVQWDDPSFDGFFLCTQINGDWTVARSEITSGGIAQPTINFNTRDPRNKGLAVRSSAAITGGGNAANSCRITVYYQILTNVIGTP